MKTLVASVLSLGVGLLIGWNLGYRHEKRETTEAVHQLVDSTEASDASEAARNARVISLLESGDSQEAVRSLSTPVAHYYTVYGNLSVNGEQRSKVRALIEQVAKTNQVLASSIDTSTLGKP